MIANKLARTFKFKSGNEDITLPCPNPNFTPEEVMTMYSNQYPELTNSTVHGPKIDNDTAVYEFKTTVGTKG